MATRAEKEAELRRIQQEIAKLQRELAQLEKDLANSRANPNLADLVPSQERTVQRTQANIARLEQRAADVEAQIAAIQEPATTTPVAPVVAPAPPTEDPTTKKAENTSSSTDVNTNSGDPGDPGPARNPKTADNQANDDNPQTSNTAALGEPVATAARPAQTAAEKLIVPQPNILDRFSSYTYQAAVYMLTPAQLTAFQRTGKKSVTGYNLLFQSGGAPNNIGGPQGSAAGAGAPDAGRNPFFPNDFYIDTITLENIPMGKGTMAAHGSTQLKFTVIEPSNITLIDCMYKAVQDLQPRSGGGAINYAAVCYLMVIRFYGYDQNGKLQAVASADQTVGQSDSSAAVEKYIPFKIKDIKWEVSSRLVSYEFDCQPIGQIVAGSTRRGTITADYELNGQTVGELLAGSVAADNVSGSAPAGARSAAGRDPNGAYRGDRTTPENPNGTGRDPNGAYRGDRTNPEPATRDPNGAYRGDRTSPTPTPPPNAGAAQQKSALRTGLVGVMNAYQQQLVKDGKAEVADEYEIVFANGAEKIRDATLFKPGSTTNKGATDMGPAPQQNPSGLSPDKGAVNPNSRNQGITAGMQMLQAIDIAIRNSNYITNQASTVITEGDDDRSEASGTAGTTSFSWYHIAMSVQQLDYDTKRNDFAYRVRYTIIPYTPQDFQSQYFPVPKFRGVVKSYPYWFTGENTAVLDYRANFNKLYVQTISGSSVETSALARSRANFAASMRDMPFVDFQARSTESAQGAAGKANELAANAAEYLYNPADNGQGEITIIGDPAWIQQGSAVGEINPTAVNYNSFTSDGTINYDTQDVLFEIVWQRPEDYDLNKGLADPYARTQDIFGDRQPRQSVIYRVIGITSEFVKGRFQQKIKGVLYRYRVPAAPLTSGDTGEIPGVTTQSGAEAERLPATSTAQAIDPRRADKPAAALSSSATPSARLAPTPTSTSTTGTTPTSSTAQGVQQLLNPLTTLANPTLTQLQSSPVYIAARRSGQTPQASLDAARQAFAATAGGSSVTSNGQAVSTSQVGGAAVVSRPQQGARDF
jgi:hypothetical protein